MCDIKQFLANHPHISINSIERELGIPSGTVRLTSQRAIPMKYIEPIKKVLYDYGMTNNDVHKSDITTPTYIVRNNVIGFVDGALFRRVSLKDNTIVIVSDLQ